MKLKNLIALIFIISIFLSKNSFSADEFLNGNRECESENIIANGYSVACKNFTSNLSNVISFTGGNYPDCAVAAASTNGVSGVNNTSVFLNKGTGATVCTTSGDQFNSPANYILSGIDGSTLISTLTVGNLSNDSFSDIAVRNNDSLFRVMATADSNGLIGTINPTTSNNNWFKAAGEAGVSSNLIERSSVLLDCNNDGNLDNAVAFLSGSTWAFNIMVNNGTGLQDASLGPYGSTVATLPPASPPSITVADFNGDKVTDIAMAIGDSSNNNQLVVCLNTKDNVTGKGTCQFTNCFNKNVTADYGAPQPNPTSIVAGDFDGDGNADVAINGPNRTNKSIIYYFGNGLSAFAFSATQEETVTTLPSSANTSPKVLTTGCFNSDNIIDVALSVSRGTSERTGYVDIFELNNARTVTKVELNFPALPILTVDIGGIDAADFDRTGRDDIIVTGTRIVGSIETRQVSVFMNALGSGVGTAVAFASPLPPNMQAGIPVQLSGQCSMSDGSTSNFTYQWTFSSSNGGTGTLVNADSLTPTFTAIKNGNFTFQLTCTTPCGSVSTAATNGTVVPGLDQGGCVSNHLSPISGPISFSGLFPLLGPVGIWLAKRRKEKEKINNRWRKLFLFLFIFLSSLVFVQTSQATTSFQTNFFKPVIDDSEYFTVYSSPLMKKSYYHAGFYLDFAQHPYEFGDVNFNRTNGITNHLLTGNFLGSYAIFDWLNVGGRLPVYFWDGIRAPLLGRANENHIDLGDVALELKFKLVDRKNHAVGWSLIPFMTAPTATHAVRDFTGNGTLTGGVKTVIDGKPHDRVALALNVGYEARDNVITPGGNSIDDHFLLGAGVSGDAIKDKLKVIAETQVETVVKQFFTKRRTTPAEGRLGFRYMFKNGVDVNAGGGLGYTNGIASPDFRVFAGVTYTKRPIAKVAIKEDVGEVGVGEELKLADKIYFEFDKAVVRSISQPTLDKAAAFIKAHPEIKKLRIEGHTCDLGTVPYNQKLSERRANAVVEYLVGQGISRSILHAVGYGELQPAVPNTDESNREQNRRVQFFVEEKE